MYQKQKKGRKVSKLREVSCELSTSNRLSWLVHLSAAGKESEAMWDVTLYLSE